MDIDSEPLPLAPLSATLGVRSAEPEPVQSPRDRLLVRLRQLAPVLGMAALAAATWWLVQHAPKPLVDAPQQAPGHVADYEMRGFTIQHQGRSGLGAGQIEGDWVRHYADDDSLEIDGLRLRWLDAEGRLTVARADRAVMRAQGDEVVLEGHARVSRAAAAGGEPLEFASAWIFIDMARELIRTDKPVVLQQGADRFEAAGLVYDHRSEDLSMTGPVHGRVQGPGGPP
ncbi:MAG: export transporter periplasmic protein LptC [Pseudomonadota bacterium]|jgi:lipopolysaccharide export system protein LptC